MSYHCEFKNQAPQPTLSLRRRSAVQNLSQTLGQAFGMIGQYLEELGEQPAGAPYVAYFNMDMQDLDIEIGFPVARKLAGKAEIQAGEFPGGKLATCVYTGPYAEIGPAYESLSEFVKANHFEPTGVAYEIYLNSPMDTPPQELRTQIVFPLKAA
ncbi:MAG: GyrI-like domain-containing protein [Anaerolineae bacterium]|jgi:effector-binding domain-containing protein|nr:GyrI-like domain-containing protein [Anaerolineae bacterium]